MSTNADETPPDLSGFPELSPLGKRLEMLRIERGLSKQRLARDAGVSRQQLWRIMSGKADLAGALRLRLAEALRVEVAELSMSPSTPAPRRAPRAPSESHDEPALSDAVSVEIYIANIARLELTLRSLPIGDAGRRLKRTLLDALEDHALEHGVSLERSFFEVRRRVLAGEI